MTDAPLLDLIRSREARDAGMESALDDQEAWGEAYRPLADRFLAEREPGDTFIGEAMRIFAIENGLGEPRHYNAWSARCGVAVRAWLKAGRIEKAGIENAHAVTSHAHQCVQYRVR